MSTSEGDRNPAKHALTMFDLTGYESDHEDTRRTAGNRESQRTGGPRRDRKSRGERQPAGGLDEDLPPEAGTPGLTVAHDSEEDWTQRGEGRGCQYDAGLRLAIQAFEERCSLLPGSSKVPVCTSSDADLWETTVAAWTAIASWGQNQEKPEVFQRNGCPVYLQEETGIHGRSIAIRRHTADSLRLASAKGIFWYSNLRMDSIFTGGEEALFGEGLAPVIEAVQQAEARPHARVRHSPPSDSGGRTVPESWEVIYPAPHYPNSVVTRSLAASLPDGIRLPVLETVSRVPVLSRDGGRLLIQRGYRPEEGIYVDIDDVGNVPPVDECVRRIDELFGNYAEHPQDRYGFPYDSPASRAHLYACPVASLIAPAVSKKPVFLIDKPTPRTGATFMADTVAIILTGENPTYVENKGKSGGSVDEMAKGLSAALSSSKGVVLMDNVTGTLDNSEWNRYATSEVWESRLLGRNDRTVRVSRRATVDIMTGNNLTLTSESAGRVCICRLDAGSDQPERRAFNWVPQERARRDRRIYVEAVTGLVSHWMAKGGLPDRRPGMWGGFEEWRDITSGILKAAGVEGFGQAVGLDLRNRMDDGGERDFVRWWWDRYRDKPVGVKELSIPEAVGDDLGREVGLLSAIKGNTARARATSLGSLLRTWQGRVYELASGETVDLTPAGTLNNRALYHLRLKSAGRRL